MSSQCIRHSFHVAHESGILSNLFPNIIPTTNAVTTSAITYNTQKQVYTPPVKQNETLEYKRLGLSKVIDPLIGHNSEALRRESTISANAQFS